MALPAGVSTCTVTVGSALSVFGSNASISVDVYPVYGGNAHQIVWSATGQPLVDFTESFTAAAGSVASFVVPHVDQAGFINGSGAAVTNWSYVATVTYTSSTNSIATRTVAFQPFVGQSSIDLDLVNDGTVTSPTTSPTATVTSVNGQTGAVTISAVGGLSDVASTITANNSTVTESKFNPVDASSGPLTVTLAAASAAGKNVAIAKTDTSTNLVTVSIANYRGSASTVSLATRNQSLLLVGKADGSW